MKMFECCFNVHSHNLNFVEAGRILKRKKETVDVHANSHKTLYNYLVVDENASTSFS